MKDAKQYASELVDCTVGYGDDPFRDISVDIEKLEEIARQIQIDTLEFYYNKADKYAGWLDYLGEIREKISELKSNKGE